MKIIVFDCGWGGDAFADRLEADFPVMEVQRIIDWRHAPYCARTEAELRTLAVQMLEKYIGKADAIVLASYDMTVAALKFLRLKYPEQVFIGMSWPIIRSDAKRVLIMTTELVRRSRDFRRTRKRLPENCQTQVCDDWMQAVDDGELSEQKIKSDTNRSRRWRPQIVVLGCTNLVDIREKIERIYRGALVLDGYKVTTKNLCRTLKLRGARVDRG